MTISETRMGQPRYTEFMTLPLRRYPGLTLSRLDPAALISRRLPDNPDVIAPDGSDVRILATGREGSMAHFTLAPGHVSRAVAHRTIEEIWYVMAGRGRLWRRLKGAEETVDLIRGVSLVIPVGAKFPVPQ